MRHTIRKNKDIVFTLGRRNYEKIFKRNDYINDSDNVILFISFYCGSNGCRVMIIVLLFSTLMLSVIFGAVSKGKVRIIYPFVVAIVFIPTVYIHYNYTALVYTVWYLIDSYLGVLIGSLIGKISRRRK